ncbi:neprilysin-1-like [Amblyomma americanum]
MKAAENVAVKVPEDAGKEADANHSVETTSSSTASEKQERRLETGFVVVVIASVGVLAFFIFQPRPDEFRSLDQQIECDNEGCRQLRLFLLSTINKSADPCRDFFSFTCAAKLEKERMSLMSEAINFKVQAMVSKASVPERGQTAFEKAVAMYRACVSLYSKNRSESAHLRHFLARLGLKPASLRLTRNPLDAMVQLSLSWGLPAIVAISEAAGSRLNYPHEARRMYQLRF